MNHLDDDAELYALGLTEPDRGPEIEAHLAGCEPCRARVAAAEEAAASLAATLPPVPDAPARRAWWPGLAAAAAVVFAAGAAFEANAARAATGRLVATDTALLAIAGSHFGHTTLVSDRGVTAKALYARDGSWMYVIARGAPPGTHVTLLRPHEVRDAGAIAGDAPASLFVRDPGRVIEVDLVGGGRVLARGKPAF
ncbi:MAG TPA: hypothetical protein VGC96_03100 [Candidatus Elarobacter sp.]